MTKKILMITNNLINHFKINICDYSLLVGLSLILRWIYITKGFDSFTLSLGLLLISVSFINEYKKR